MKKFIWQDIVLMIGGFVFAPSLVFTIMARTDVPLLTSLPTAIVLLIFAFCMWTLKLRLAAIANLLTSICWFIIVYVGI